MITARIVELDNTQQFGQIDGPVLWIVIRIVGLARLVDAFARQIPFVRDQIARFSTMVSPEIVELNYPEKFG